MTQEDIIRDRLAQPEQVPIGQLWEDTFGRGQVMWFQKPPNKAHLYIEPQPAWKPLTDEQIGELITSEMNEYEIARAAIAKATGGAA